MPRILITGAGGQVGQELQRARWPAGWELRALSRASLDIADQSAVSRAVEGCDLIINAAAYTAVDQAESDRNSAFRVNETGPALLAKAAAAAGIGLLHISTDYVFDGSKQGAWVEEDPVHPLGVYGESKEAGERALREALSAHLIMRTSWVYAAHGKNFCKTMLRVGAERDELKVVSDQVGAPTTSEDIAAALVTIAKAWLGDGPRDYGTFHYTASGKTSWHGFAEAIFDLAEKDWGRRPTVEAIPTSAYPTPAARPQNSVLDCSKIMNSYAPHRPDWRDALARVYREIKAIEAKEVRL